MITEDRLSVAPYVSSVDDPVYAITGLPEEVISVLFAYASRNPKSFRENLAKMIEEADIPPSSGNQPVTTERARKFHEKWVVGYGHSSVAEHTTIHIAVEGISRFASEALELASPHLSFTEKSQRYQKIDAGNVYYPQVSSHLQRRLEDFFGTCFDLYEETVKDLGQFISDEGILPGASDTAIERRAMEDARYLLPLATTTQLGLTGNARAISDTIKVLARRPEPELTDLAGQLYKAASGVAPTLVRHPSHDVTLDTTPEDEASKGFISYPIFHDLFRGLSKHSLPDYRQLAPPEAAVLTMMLEDDDLGRVILSGAGVPWSDWYVHGKSARQALMTVLKEILKSIDPHDDPPPWLNTVQIPIQWVVSEATWHQLLRHRTFLFSVRKPTPVHGLVPPRVFWLADQKGLNQPMERLKYLQEVSYGLSMDLSTGDHIDLLSVPYIVLNGAMRKAYSVAPLGHLVHAARLRTSPRAQEEIRSVFTSLISVLSSDAYLGNAASELFSKEVDRS